MQLGPYRQVSFYHESQRSNARAAGTAEPRVQLRRVGRASAILSGRLDCSQMERWFLVL